MHRGRNAQYVYLTTLVVVVVALGGCESIPKDVLKLSQESLEIRSLQTRKYEGILETDLLAASAGVIQDLGFNIDESETRLGVIVGSKDRSAVETGQVAAAVFLALLGGNSVAYDKNQKLKVSLVVRPESDRSDTAYLVRVTFQRLVWNTQNQLSKAESLEEPGMYQEFFERLSKAVFLEGQKI